MHTGTTNAGKSRTPARSAGSAAQAAKRAEEKPDPQPTPSQRKHQNDLVRKLNNAGQGRASRKD